MALFTTEFGDARRTKVLLVEDDGNDRTLFCLAVQRAHLSLEIQEVSNGQGALDYLERKAPFQDARVFQAPELVILDLEMPVMDGFEFLRQVRSSPLWRTCQWWCSAEGGRREEAAAWGGLAVLEKPFGLDRWVSLLHELWLLANPQCRRANAAHSIVPGGHRMPWINGRWSLRWSTHPAQTPYSE